MRPWCSLKGMRVPRILAHPSAGRRADRALQPGSALPLLDPRNPLSVPWRSQMRVRSSLVTLALVSVGVVPVGAQSAAPPEHSPWSFDVGGGVSRIGVHGMAGLEYAMTRWMSARADAITRLEERIDRDAVARRVNALAMSVVLTTPPEKRLSAYVLGGYGASAAQGLSMRFGPLGAGGLRLNLGRVQPYIEARVQHTVGSPIILGVRY